MKILIIDNYDSFTYNLYHLIEAVMPGNYALKVKRNDEINITEIDFFDKLIISPGPGLPKDAGITCEVIKKYASSKKILGVCLGHQAIAEVFGAELVNLENVLHGVAIETYVSQPSDKIFNSCPESFLSGRYHSWVVDEKTVPDSLKIIAKDKFGHIMAIRHCEYDVVGVQFHPESVLTNIGRQILANWLES